MTTRTRVRTGEGWSEVSPTLFAYRWKTGWSLHLYLWFWNTGIGATLTYFSDDKQLDVGEVNKQLDAGEVKMSREEGLHLLNLPALEVIGLYAEEISWLRCDR